MPIADNNQIEAVRKGSVRASEKLSSQAQSESELLSEDEDYFMVAANDLDKDTMQLQIINDDHLSGSYFFNPADSVNKSGFDANLSSQVNMAGRMSLERPASAKGQSVLNLPSGKNNNYDAKDLSQIKESNSMVHNQSRVSAGGTGQPYVMAMRASEVLDNSEIELDEESENDSEAGLSNRQALVPTRVTVK